MIAWMVYAALVAVLIAAGALALERLVASAGRREGSCGWRR